MTRPLAFFLGAGSSFNVRRLVANIGWILADDRDCHLVTTATEAVDLASPDKFTVYGTDRPPTLRGGVAALRSYLSTTAPATVVQLTRPPIHGTITGLLAARAGVPFVYRYGGDRFRSYRTSQGLDRLLHFTLNNILGRVPLRYADRAIVLGPAGQGRLSERGVGPDRITVLPPTIDYDRFAAPVQPATVPDVPNDQAVSLTVGRLSRRKGLKTMERIIPAVLERRMDIQFVFVGGGDREPAVPAEWQSNVTVVGPVEPNKMPAYYRRADLLVHPSLNEGLPRVVLESLATGTPVVARDVGEIATATENTFTSDAELVELITEFESLPLDDAERFSRETLRSEYLEFFAKYQ